MIIRVFDPDLRAAQRVMHSEVAVPRRQMSRPAVGAERYTQVRRRGIRRSAAEQVGWVQLDLICTGSCLAAACCTCSPTSSPSWPAGSRPFTSMLASIPLFLPDEILDWLPAPAQASATGGGIDVGGIDLDRPLRARPSVRHAPHVSPSSSSCRRGRVHCRRPPGLSDVVGAPVIASCLGCRGGSTIAATAQLRRRGPTGQRGEQGCFDGWRLWGLL